MNAFKSELQTLVARHVAAAAPQRMLHLVESLIAGEPDLHFHGCDQAAVEPLFLNLGADGKPTAGEHVAVYQAGTGLIWTAAPLDGGKCYSHANAGKAAAELNLLGSKCWRLPTIQELLSIVDYGRCDPAVDSQHFKGPYGWTWSSTVAAAPSGGAWGVDLDFGASYRGSQSRETHVLAVRAGQQFGLGI